MRVNLSGNDPGGDSTCWTNHGAHRGTEEMGRSGEFSRIQSSRASRSDGEIHPAEFARRCVGGGAHRMDGNAADSLRLSLCDLFPHTCVGRILAGLPSHRVTRQASPNAANLPSPPCLRGLCGLPPESLRLTRMATGGSACGTTRQSSRRSWEDPARKSTYFRIKQFSESSNQRKGMA